MTNFIIYILDKFFILTINLININFKFNLLDYLLQLH
jgi:hypothetical protein